MKLTILVENFIAFQNVRSFFNRIKDEDFLTLDLFTHVQYDHILALIFQMCKSREELSKIVKF